TRGAACSGRWSQGIATRSTRASRAGAIAWNSPWAAKFAPARNRLVRGSMVATSLCSTKARLWCGGERGGPSAMAPFSPPCLRPQGAVQAEPRGAQWALPALPWRRHDLDHPREPPWPCTPRPLGGTRASPTDERARGKRAGGRHLHAHRLRAALQERRGRPHGPLVRRPRSPGLTVLRPAHAVWAMMGRWLLEGPPRVRGPNTAGLTWPDT